MESPHSLQILPLERDTPHCQTSLGSLSPEGAAFLNTNHNHQKLQLVLEVMGCVSSEGELGKNKYTAVVCGIVLYLHVVGEHAGNGHPQLLFLVCTVGNKVLFKSSMQQATATLDISQTKHLSAASYFGTGRTSPRSRLGS